MTVIGYFQRIRVLTLVVLVSLFLSACSKSQPEGDKNAGGPPAYEGYHDITNCSSINGWAWDMHRPDEPVKIEIYEGDTLLATVTADLFRKDLLDAHKGNGKHGFSYPVPPRLKDGKQHSIREKFAGANIDLQFTPKTITCNFDE